MKFSDFLTYFTDTIFRRDVTEWRNPVVRWLVQQYRLLFYTARGLLEHGTIVRSAALTFYTLMSLVPILAVVFAVVKGFGLADGLIENLYGLFPRNPDIVDYIVNFAENALARTQGGVVAAVALVMLFWAVIRVFGSIESAFNNIWEVKVERSITRQWTDYIAVVMIVPILWIVANAVGNYAEQLLGFDDSWYFNLLSHLASMIVIWVMFTFLYIVIPNARVRFGSALMAGIVAGTIFLLFQWGYVYVQRWMTSYNAIYGSFAALPLLLIWMQTSWEILLFGGELSFAYQNIARFGEERESLLISYDQRRKVLLAVMLIVVALYAALVGDDASVFARPAPFVLALGLFQYLFFSNRKPMAPSLGILLIVETWLIAFFILAIPFYLSGFSFANSLFESVSAFTTTGATILTDVDAIDGSLLIWRAVMQWAMMRLLA